MVVQTGNTLQRPPRLTGEQQGDLRALQRWMSDLYNALVLSGNIVGTQDDQEERIQALETFVFPPGYSFKAQGFTVDPTGVTVIGDDMITFSPNGQAVFGNNQITLNANGQAIYGDSDARRVRIFPQVGNGAAGAQTFQVSRVGSNSETGVGGNVWVMKTSWVLTSTTPGAGVRYGHHIGITSGAGVDPGETWGLLITNRTSASVASANKVGAYAQVSRTALPSAGVGVPILGAVLEMRDESGAPSSAGGQMRGLEIDLSANDVDDYGTGYDGRGALVVILTKLQSGGVTPTFANIFGIFSPDPTITVRTVLRPNNFIWSEAVLDCRTGTEGGSANTIWLADGQHIALDTDGDTTLSSDGTTITLDGEIKIGAAGAFSANGAVATALTGVGPAGANTTVQEWLEITNDAGTKRYIPCF